MNLKSEKFFQTMKELEKSSESDRRRTKRDSREKLSSRREESEMKKTGKRRRKLKLKNNKS
jgi:hypothetical protein